MGVSIVLNAFNEIESSVFVNICFKQRKYILVINQNENLFQNRFCLKIDFDFKRQTND